MDASRLRENLETIRGRLADAARRSGRDPVGVRLVAVTKRRSTEAVRALVDLGVADLGENYPRELWEKADALPGIAARWHLIGHLQGNKARRTLPTVAMLHGVDSAKLLRTLDDLAMEMDTDGLPPICLQVNASGEETKHGWTPEGLLADADTIAAQGAIPIVGLMTMAAAGPTPESARPAFARLRALRDELRTRTGLDLPQLSIGMSGDYEVAVEEGATLVRIGSALFEGVDP